MKSNTLVNCFTGGQTMAHTCSHLTYTLHHLTELECSEINQRPIDHLLGYVNYWGFLIYMQVATLLLQLKNPLAHSVKWSDSENLWTHPQTLSTSCSGSIAHPRHGLAAKNYQIGATHHVVITKITWLKPTANFSNKMSLLQRLGLLIPTFGFIC